MCQKIYINFIHSKNWSLNTILNFDACFQEFSQTIFRPCSRICAWLKQDFCEFFSNIIRKSKDQISVALRSQQNGRISMMLLSYWSFCSKYHVIKT